MSPVADLVFGIKDKIIIGIWRVAWSSADVLSGPAREESLAFLSISHVSVTAVWKSRTVVVGATRWRRVLLQVASSDKFVVDILRRIAFDGFTNSICTLGVRVASGAVYAIFKSGAVLLGVDPNHCKQHG
jgi:hypothetical protein